MYLPGLEGSRSAPSLGRPAKRHERGTARARPARNASRGVEPSGVLAIAALGALLIGLASPVPVSRTTPVPKPAPTNPFSLDPTTPPPLSSPLPVIGTTRAKPVCSAIRRAIAPAVAAALKNDQTYGGLRKKIFDYVVKDSEEARDLHLMQMDRQVDAMVKNISTLEESLKSSALDIPGTAKPEDAKALREMKSTLTNVLAAQKGQLNAMSGFVETERMRRFGQLSESELNMQRANAPNISVPGGGLQTPVPVSGFLRDTQNTFNPQHRTVSTLNDAHLLDRDLGDISALTTHYEDAAAKVIIPAANSCK
ncbi:MAG: hypothetical protein QOD51_623 [Candidatus Eremiobacteraeota bacterium]|nr:hypothetical protein [Candidatus Eremiobacteraeota bacterium]